VAEILANKDSGSVISSRRANILLVEGLHVRIKSI